MYHYTREYSDAAVRRFVKRAGINKANICNLREVPLFKLRAGERQGNGLKKEPITQRQVDFENRIKNMFECGGAAEINDLQINGHILMEAFGLKPGPQIGIILEYLVEEVRKNKAVNNRLDLLSLVLSYLKNQDKHSQVNLIVLKEGGGEKTSPGYQSE
jgi:poly(A) polymerase/tRNA nucleotidyltransferase (CCA-adding enzyme)